MWHPRVVVDADVEEKEEKRGDQEYKSNYQVFFFVSSSGARYQAGLRIYTKESNRSGGRKCGKGMRLQSPLEWCMSYIYI